ncbi:hypothetical protein [Acidipropionibacterium timonense]|uniref:hypothetical protein n=1 Tax=Acidipropionibacterium timonense TaxID=2161818 RepID=UPI001030C818|nr:hypothetical protein [Acidipropionibacterium timonense]
MNRTENIENLVHLVTARERLMTLTETAWEIHYEIERVTPMHGVIDAEDLDRLQGRARLLSVELRDFIGPVDALLAGTLELFDTTDDVDASTTPGLKQDPLDFEGGTA